MNDKTIKAIYDYADETGQLLYQNVRFEPKDFRQRRPDGKGGFIWQLNGTRRVLYRLRELIQANPADVVFYAEGEKDVENLRSIGLTATTAGGVSSWKDDFAKFLCDRRVCILPDNDKPGYEYAVKVATTLRLYGCKDVRIVKLPDLPEKGDISDWLDAHDSAEPETLKARLLDLYNKAPIYSPAQEKLPTLKTICAADIIPQTIEYTVPDVLPRGMYTLFQAAEDAGKSTVAQYLTSLITSGGIWPNTGEQVRAGDVLVFNHEEDPGKTTIPRLIANGANLKRVHLISDPFIETENGEDIFDFEHNIKLLYQLADQWPDLRLVVFDPINSYTNADENSNMKVRRALKPLIDFATERNIAVLGLTHLNKKIELGANNRTIGSRAWSATPRMKWQIDVEKAENEEGHKVETGNRFLWCTKCNIGQKPQGFTFRIGEGGQVVLTGERNNYQGESDTGGIKASRKDEIGEWLLDRLKSGSEPQKTISAEACKKFKISNTRLGVIASDVGIQKRFSTVENCWVWGKRI